MLETLDAQRVEELLRPGGPWTRLAFVAETGSTNTDLAHWAREGRAEAGTVLVTELQRAGKGRQGRGWQAPPGRALTFSSLLHPKVPAPRWGWLPLLAGISLRDAVTEATGVSARLKWPNDLLAPDGRKLAGVLAERVEVGEAALAVIGIGLNVSQRDDELPAPSATSLVLAGAGEVDRESLLARILDELGARLLAWEAAGGDPDQGLRKAYRQCSATLGTLVRVALPTGDVLAGTALDVDHEGCLVVRPEGSAEVVAVAAGDVVHVR
ncbi:MAG TPA: biotin--[acetyl-CoA-carboxylase] ligase [Actinomycetes bacterium]|nr:biotin--[acetyl-CoA-carboxylase] ligase [Actinomycetes bacterium]